MVLGSEGCNVTNATIRNNVFIRNGAQQLSDDRGELFFARHGSASLYSVCVCVRARV